MTRTSHPIDPRRRILALLAVFSLVSIGFIASLVDLAAVRDDRYRDLGQEQRTRSVSLAGYRGTIFDRDGSVLAQSTPGQQLVVDPQKVVDPVATAAVLAPVLGVDAATLVGPLTPESIDDRYGLLVESLDDDALARFLDLRTMESTEVLVAGVSVETTEERIYPADRLARPIIGQVDGGYGLEWQFDEALQGTAGVDRHERSAFGIISVGEREVEPARAGDDIYLTIDQNLQYVLEETLITHCQDTLAQGAEAVVSNPQTGEIMAMATVVRTEAGNCVVPIYNSPTVHTFEPGSVIKIVTAAAAVEDLGYTAGTTFDVPNSITVADYDFDEPHEHPVAPYPIEQIIAQSMNVGTIMMAQQVGPERLRHYLEAFGFGQESGLGWKDEASGSIRPVTEWHGADFGSIPIGQGMTVNTVQLAMAYNTIANDGVYLAPKLIRSIVASDGTEREQPAQESRRVISSAAAEEVAKMLTAVVDANGIGTGRAAAVPGYTVAGKTGTAWKVFEGPDGKPWYGGPGNRRYVVSFAGFLPAQNPQLSIVVMVDEPQTHTTAGLVAAPVFADIALYAARILRISPEHSALADGEIVRGTPATVPIVEVPAPVAPDATVAAIAPVDADGRPIDPPVETPVAQTPAPEAPAPDAPVPEAPSQDPLPSDGVESAAPAGG